MQSETENAQAEELVSVGIKRLFRQVLQHPQSLWARKVVFQIHLWIGLAVALYVCLISISGSAIVFRRDLERHRLERRLIAVEQGQDWRVTEPAPSAIDRVLGWLTDLHDNLLLGWTGRVLNGLGSALVTLLASTGVVVWWPGIKNWRRSLTIQPNTRFPRFNWDVHSATGFWSLLFVLIWGVSGLVLCFPGLLDSLLNVHVRYWATRLHFGRFNVFTEVLWTCVGLTPAVLALTGVIMWWNRVVHKIIARARRKPSIIGAVADKAIQ